jgi:hypothetical protein
MNDPLNWAVAVSEPTQKGRIEDSKNPQMGFDVHLWPMSNPIVTMKALEYIGSLRQSFGEDAKVKTWVMVGNQAVYPPEMYLNCAAALMAAQVSHPEGWELSPEGVPSFEYLAKRYLTALILIPDGYKQAMSLLYQEDATDPKEPTGDEKASEMAASTG